MRNRTANAPAEDAKTSPKYLPRRIFEDRRDKGGGVLLEDPLPTLHFRTVQGIQN